MPEVLDIVGNDTAQTTEQVQWMDMYVGTVVGSVGQYARSVLSGVGRYWGMAELGTFGTALALPIGVIGTGTTPLSIH